jgi:hypothetical protein
VAKMSDKFCPHYGPKEPGLFDPGQEFGICRYYQGGMTCSRRDVFLCETGGKKTRQAEAEGKSDAGEF